MSENNKGKFSVEQIFSDEHGFGELHIPQNIYDDVNLPFSKYSLAIFRNQNQLKNENGFQKKILVGRLEAQSLTDNHYDKINKIYENNINFLDNCYHLDAKIVVEPPKK